MNHPILNDGANVVLLCTHTRGRGSIKVERNSHKREYAIVIRVCNKERQIFRIETLPQGETPQTRHQQQMLVGDQEKTSTKRPNGCLC
jgi:hypothetical protein